MLFVADMRRTASTGFTLLELLVALAIASLLLGIAAPRLYALVPAFELDRATRILAIDLERARWLAITRNARSRLVIDLVAGSYVAEVEGGSSYVPVFARDLGAGVGFDAAASTRVVDGRIVFVFQPRGNTATLATVALQASGDLGRRVIVNAAGRARID